MSKNVLEKREPCLLGNDIEPIPDGFELMRRVIGCTHYFFYMSGALKSVSPQYELVTSESAHNKADALNQAT
jgi:glutamate racemase